MPSSLAAAVAAEAAKTSAPSTSAIRKSSSQGQRQSDTTRSDDSSASASSSASPSSSPYLMCSRQECQDREKWGQVSVWEATNETRHFCNPKQRRMDPRKAVKKYRRSAAGRQNEEEEESGSSATSSSKRSLSQLVVTVDHLVHLLATMGELPENSNNKERNTDKNQSWSSLSFVDLVNFVEDRIRAVQVDLVHLQSPSSADTKDSSSAAATKKQLQYRLIKAHILILYLLSDVSSASTTTGNGTAGSTQTLYSFKFGHQALATALSNYWVDDNNTNDHGGIDPQFYQYDDEVLSYMAMYELHKDLEQKPCSTTDNECCLASNILFLYRKHVTQRTSTTCQQESEYPLFQWTMQVIVACNLGHWHVALKMLYEKGRRRRRPAAAPKNAEDDNDERTVVMFGNLIRCTLTMMPSSTSGRSTGGALFKLRCRALQSYNVSLRKQEAVCGEDVARLLVCVVNNYNNKVHNGLPKAGGDDKDKQQRRMLTANDGMDEEQTTGSDDSSAFLDARYALHLGKCLGLPVIDDDETTTALVFKAAPISVPGDDDLPINFHIRDDDAYVLSNVDSWRHYRHSSGRGSIGSTCCDEVSSGILVPSETWIDDVLTSYGIIR